MHWQKIQDLVRFGTKPDLDRITKLLNALDNPQLTYPTIHVAGTNGKGSVSYMIAKALQAAGYNTGLYTSPHLTKYNERIKINDTNITDEELEQAAKTIIDHGGEETTFFEATTAMAFQHFKNKNVDIAVIEVGLGGLWDATNLVEPILSVITTIGNDHEEILGHTIEERIDEKAGIIKQNSTVIIGDTNPHVIATLKQICAERNSTPVLVDHTTPVTPPLLGAYQEQNTRIALTAIHELNNKNYTITDEHINQGWTNLRWPGRMDKRGNILFEGAHNVDGMRYLATYLKENQLKPIIILGIKQTKNAEEMVKLIAPHAKTLICTEASFKPTPAQELFSLAFPYCPDIVICPNINSALDLALSFNQEIVVTGSLYLVGDALSAYKKKEEK